MSKSKRQLVLDALDNKPVDRVPVGFWFHFVPEEECFKGLEDASIIQRNIEGHRRFIQTFQPDMVKLMCDGFFGYPSPILANAKAASELAAMEPLGPDHPWIRGQLELVRTLTALAGEDVPTFYNIFAPATFFKSLFGSEGDRILADFIVQDPEATTHALNVIAEDIALLAGQAIEEGGADGIYLSVQQVQDSRITPDLYDRVVAPGELRVLERANEASDYNILHICGYERKRNELARYAGYPSKAVNWAVTSERVGLAEGKKLFGGRAVIGGFDNNPTGVLYTGTREEVEAFTDDALRQAEGPGYILGADCTVPMDIGLERLDWVRDRAATFAKQQKPTGTPSR